jgi:2-desacetyl-2-hydroxyethyl bacteriochlorophyllide A dehydrogenase
MKALVITAPGEAGVHELSRPVLSGGQVLVQVAACGLCGTDLHTLEGTNPLARYPCVPGHEFAGQVVEAASDVRSPAVGDVVSVDPSRSCGYCRECKRGRPNLCPDKGGYGSRLPGGFAELVAVDARACERLPPGVPPRLGILAEPIACMLHAVDRLGPVLGDDVLVYGAGPIGVIAAQLLARGGARSVSVVDPSAHRLEGLPGSVSASAASAEDLAARGPADEGWDVAATATGAPAAVADALHRLRPGGRLLIAGVAPPGATVPVEPFDLYRREITLIGTMALAHTFARATRLLGETEMEWPALVSHWLPLDAFGDALALVRAARGRKIAIVPSEEDE